MSWKNKLDWKNKSVQLLLASDSSIENPIELIKIKAQKLVTYGLSKGWEGPPFNPIRLAKILGYRILPNAQVLDARIIPVTKNKFEIEYNPHQNKKRINFSIAHEIAHTLFEDCSDEIRHREKKDDDNWELELLCNTAAAEILLPANLFMDDVNSSEFSFNKIKKLSSKYQVSIETLLYKYIEFADQELLLILSEFSDGNQGKLVPRYITKSRTFKAKYNKVNWLRNDSVYQCVNPGQIINDKAEIKFLGGKEFNLITYGLSNYHLNTNQKVTTVISPQVKTQNTNISKYVEIFGDATQPIIDVSKNKIILQLVNTSGAVGGGFGKAMAEKWPDSKKNVLYWKKQKNNFKLGGFKLFSLDDENNIYVFQFVAQKGIKSTSDSLSYEHLFESLNSLLALLTKEFTTSSSIHLPKFMGSGSAKGNWEIVKSLLNSVFVLNDISVFAYILKDNFTPFKKETNQISLFVS